MTTESMRFSARILPLLLAIAIASACSSRVTPTAEDEELDVVHESAARPEPDADAADVPDSLSDRVEVFEAGAGDATVVFESGLGNDWTSWEPVAREVAVEARVFAYSRPGYGHSEPTDDPRDASTIVEQLRALLASGGYAPPYVLVGHSFGGTYMELFAKAHPEEVAGLVLVDPRHRDFTSACEQAGLAGCTIPASVLPSLRPVEIAEYEAFASTSDEIRVVGGFGAHPVRVLTATWHSFGPEPEPLWESMLASLAGEAADGEQILFTGAGHGLQTERPHEVAAVILSLVSPPGI